jgi:hypothetical protein
MRAATTPLRGKPGIDRPARKVSVRKGKRKAVSVSIRKRKGPKLPPIPGLPSASAAYVTVKHPAVWVQHFAVSGGSQYSSLRRGIANMLISDLGPPLAAACGGILVEREHLGFLITEQLRSQGPGFDPSTRIPTDRMIAHNREVSGRLAVTRTRTTLTVNVKNVATGTTRSVTRSAATERFFELESSIIDEVVRLICGDKPPEYYAGSVSGSISVQDGSEFDMFSWSGNVRLKYTGAVEPENAGEPAGEYAIYEPESGSIHVIVDGVSANGDCPYHGEADVRSSRRWASRTPAYSRGWISRPIRCTRRSRPARHRCPSWGRRSARAASPTRTRWRTWCYGHSDEPALVVDDPGRGHDRRERPGNDQEGVVAGARGVRFRGGTTPISS